MQRSGTSRPPARTIIMLAVTGLVAWALFSAGRPVLAQACVQPAAITVDFGAAWMNAVRLTYTSGVTSGCPTTVEGFQTSGNTSDFSIQSGPAPGCIGFTWTSANLNKKCYITVTFNPTATGIRSVMITPTVSNNVSVSSLTVKGAGFTIMPSSAQAPQQYINDFALALPEPQDPNPPFSAGYGSITFDSGDATVSWTPTLRYQTSGKIPKPPAQPSPAPTPFQTGSSGPLTLGFGTPIPGASPTPSATFPLAGGAITLDAQTAIGSANDPMNWEYSAAITGIAGGICGASITNELESLYADENAACTGNSQPWSCCTGNGAGACAPATPNLFALIAWKESNYRQFYSTKNADGLDNGLWPNESPTTPKGLYIGLMQVALQKNRGNSFASPLDTAWNWLTNSQVSYDLFNQKIGNAVAIQNAALKIHPSLKNNPLTQYQIENMALLEYGTRIAKTPTKQYYVVKCISGSCNWINNPIYKKIITYADAVRNPKQPLPTTTTCN